MQTDLPPLMPMRNPMQPYAWGSTEAIARLQGREPTGSPEAELWMGAHPKAPSGVFVSGRWRRLDALITERGEELLGPNVFRRWGGRLPFLLKILAAAQPLSIQVHPNLEQAQQGFARENQRGIALDAPERSYRDPMHKPELLYALGSFWVMAGLRDFAASRVLVDGLPAPRAQALFAQAATRPHDQRMAELWSALLRLSRDAQKKLASEIGAAAHKGDLDAPLRRWILELATRYPDDAGVLMPLLLNVFELRAGEAVALRAGIPHAYLHGLGVELMASSDNVLRGGLTPKHVDVDELLSVMRFEPMEPPSLEARVGDGGQIFDCGVDEFALSCVELRDGALRRLPPVSSAQILLVTRGRFVLCSGKARLEVSAGESVFRPASAIPAEITGSGQIVWAGVAEH